MKIRATLLLAGSFAFASPALAQDHSGHEMHMPPPPPAAPQPAPAPAPTDPHAGHAGHDMAGMDDNSADCGSVDYAGPVRNPWSKGSGTARLPGEETMYQDQCIKNVPINRPPPSHVMVQAGAWHLMLHGTTALQYTDHSGPRGVDKLYVTSMAMLMAETEPDWGRVQLKTMLSLEPAMRADGYPNLFATGELAFGQPLVDRQHPHDLFMELAARVEINLDATGETRLSLYGGPVGEPALGPSAFMHRRSSRYNPEPPITHHWFDSTHITYGVATLGLSGTKWQVEVSTFRGAEPDERRWNIETPKFDSWSVRATLNPTPNWALQASYGEIKQPEVLHVGEDEHRFTASVHYDDGNNLSAMLAFSNKQRVPGDSLTAWLAEANWDLSPTDSLFGRFENVANDELFPDHHDPLHDIAFRVSKFQLGYARRIPLGPFELALGGSANVYAKPSALDAAYGRKPWGYTLFAKLFLGQ